MAELAFVAVVILICPPLAFICHLWIDNSKKRRQLRRQRMARTMASLACSLDEAIQAARVNIDDSQKRRQQERVRVGVSRLHELTERNSAVGTFNYTITRSKRSPAYHITDQGGFAEIPVFLHGETGTCFRTQHILFLN